MSALGAFLERALTPEVLLALFAAAGIACGRLKAGGFSLSAAGALVCGVLSGMVLSAFPQFTAGGYTAVLYSPAFEEKLSFLSAGATALFMAAVGLEAGRELTGFDRKKVQAALTGAAMVLGGGTVVLLCCLGGGSLTPSAGIGVFAGALTSTPALSAAAEFETVVSAELVSGYGVSYLFGVLSVVLLVQFRLRQSAAAPKAEKEPAVETRGGKGLLAVFSVIAAGGILGAAELPGIRFSFGAAAGTLFAGILAGRILAKRRHCFSPAVLGTLKSLGLTLFLLAMGLKGGAAFIQKADIRCLMLGALTTLAALFVGWLLTAGVFKMKKTESLSILCGGMTSTPALGVLSQRAEAELSLYTASYIGALLVLVLFARALCCLFC